MSCCEIFTAILSGFTIILHFAESTFLFIVLFVVYHMYVLPFGVIKNTDDDDDDDDDDTGVSSQQ